MTIDCDIFVSGGGIAGLFAATALAREGWHVHCCDPALGSTQQVNRRRVDNRITALLSPSVDCLARYGIWELLAADATPLRTLRIVDSTGGHDKKPIEVDFSSHEIGLESFGYSLPNATIVHSLLSLATEMPNVTLHGDTGTRSFVSRTKETVVELCSRQRVSCRLLVGADGQQSSIRSLAGIRTVGFNHGQHALTFNVSHEVAQDMTSIEIHSSGGPFTTVPIQQIDGKCASAVVWTESSDAALRLLHCPQSEFEDAATQRSLSLLGSLKLATPRHAWPISTRIATRFSAHRVALVAEAAHVLPPIGAQGLNASIADIAFLADCIARGNGDPGSREILSDYGRSRRADMLARTAAVSALSFVSQADNHKLLGLRTSCLKAIGRVDSVKQLLMRAGTKSDLFDKAICI